MTNNSEAFNLSGLLTLATEYKTKREMNELENKETPYKITPQGSLGLLALGAVGVRKWKEVVAEKDRSKTIEENQIQEDNGIIDDNKDE